MCCCLFDEFFSSWEVLCPIFSTKSHWIQKLAPKSPCTLFLGKWVRCISVNIQKGPFYYWAIKGTIISYYKPLNVARARLPENGYSRAKSVHFSAVTFYLCNHFSWEPTVAFIFNAFIENVFLLKKLSTYIREKCPYFLHNSLFWIIFHCFFHSDSRGWI